MKAAITAAVILAFWVYAADNLIGGKVQQQLAQAIR